MSKNPDLQCIHCQKFYCTKSYLVKHMEKCQIKSQQPKQPKQPLQEELKEDNVEKTKVTKKTTQKKEKKTEEIKTAKTEENKKPDIKQEWHQQQNNWWLKTHDQTKKDGEEETKNKSRPLMSFTNCTNPNLTSNSGTGSLMTNQNSNITKNMTRNITRTTNKTRNINITLDPNSPITKLWLQYLFTCVNGDGDIDQCLEFLKITGLGLVSIDEEEDQVEEVEEVEEDVQYN